RGHRLVVLVVANQATEGIRREHLGRPEMARGKGELPGAAHAYQHDQAELRDLEIGHRGGTAPPAVAARVAAAGGAATQSARYRIAIYVGNPDRESSTPPGSNRTEYPYAHAAACAHARNSARLHSNR